MTNQIEEKAWEYIEKIDRMGGMLAAIDQGYPQKEIANASYKFQQQIDNAEKVMVGVNKYIDEEGPDIDTLKIEERVTTEQINRLHEVKRQRDSRALSAALKDVRAACKSDTNVMPSVIEAVKAYATEQEICDIFREQFGIYHDPAFY